jgi:hypothetical protein
MALGTGVGCRCPQTKGGAAPPTRPAPEQREACSRRCGASYPAALKVTQEGTCTMSMTTIGPIDVPESLRETLAAFFEDERGHFVGAIEPSAFEDPADYEQSESWAAQSATDARTGRLTIPLNDRDGLGGLDSYGAFLVGCLWFYVDRALNRGWATRPAGLIGTEALRVAAALIDLIADVDDACARLGVLTESIIDGGAEGLETT